MAKRHVAGEDGLAVFGHGQRPGEGLEVLRGVVVGGAGDADIFVDDRSPFFLNCWVSTSARDWNPMPIMLSAAPTARVFCSTLLRLLCGQFGDGQGAELHPVRSRAGLDRVSVVDHAPRRGPAGAGGDPWCPD